MQDAQLMLRVRGGDEEAFREIVESYQKPIFDLCFRYIGNRADAEEVAMDVFVRLYKARGTYKPEAKLSTFLYRGQARRSRVARGRQAGRGSRKPRARNGYPQGDRSASGKTEDGPAVEALRGAFLRGNRGRHENVGFGGGGAAFPRAGDAEENTQTPPRVTRASFHGSGCFNH
jgi:RNA polymerase sigma factor (sigma-70 family)